MRLIIEVYSQPVACGLPRGGSAQGKSFIGFKIVHELVGNNDPFVREMTDALISLCSYRPYTITMGLNRSDNPVIGLTDIKPDCYQQAIMDVQAEYERTVAIMDARKRSVLRPTG